MLNCKEEKMFNKYFTKNKKIIYFDTGENIQDLKEIF